MKQRYRWYFLLILLEAIPVFVAGYFFPSQLDAGFSWVVLPPLHAQFVAALYLFGSIYMVGCLLTPDWQTVRWAIPLTVVFTGLLFVVSLIHLDNFEFDRVGVWIWLVAYFLDPLIGIWLIWQGDWKLSPSTLPNPIRGWLGLQGAIFSMVGLVMLISPDTMVKAWAWKVSPTLAQFYAGPMLAYGLTSLITGWQGTWSQVKLVAPAMLGFALATLIASYKHNNLFASDELADVIWFGGFAVIIAATGWMSYRSYQA